MRIPARRISSAHRSSAFIPAFIAAWFMAVLTKAPRRRLTHDGEIRAMSAGVLYVVATPIGNLADSSPRSLDILRMVDIVACEDTRTTRTLLARNGIETQTVSLHEHNERAALAS